MMFLSFTSSTLDHEKTPTDPSSAPLLYSSRQTSPHRFPLKPLPGKYRLYSMGSTQKSINFRVLSLNLVWRCMIYPSIFGVSLYPRSVYSLEDFSARNDHTDRRLRGTAHAIERPCTALVTSDTV
ncbi:hypothetical protein PM082_015357 [Marasmius tenuissimus]|nr:hypothetical protein PM082_015357 [Marasmius tenuissimus]